jgi:hypothetical protein
MLVSICVVYVCCRNYEDRQANTITDMYDGEKDLFRISDYLLNMNSFGPGEASTAGTTNRDASWSTQYGYVNMSIVPTIWSI